MNAEGRKKLDQCLEALNLVVSELEELADAEQEKYDNLSEGLQQSERGQRFEEVASALSDAKSSVEHAIGQIEDAQS